MARPPKRLAPAAPPRLLRAIDVSSAQPRDLTAIIQAHQPDMVIVKGYQPEEKIGAGWTPNMTQQWTRDQVASCRDNGIELTTLYMWLYSDLDPRRAVNNELELAASMGLQLVFLADDVETYGAAHAIPSAATVAAALDECDKQGLRSVTYSSKAMWRLIGDPDFSGRESWEAGGARYNVGGDWPDDLDSDLGFGKTTVIGQQWTSVPLDRSLFRL